MSYLQLMTQKFTRLREKAEQLIKRHPEIADDIPTDMFDLIHELKVHQAELEIQNEELENAQKEYAELYEEYQDLYENAPCGYVTLNDQGMITRANQTAVNYFLSDKKFLFSTTFTKCVKKEWQNSFLSKREEARKENSRRQIELPLNSKIKSPFWVQVTIFPVLNEDNDLIEWRLTLEDITASKKYEEELVESREKAVQNEQFKSKYLANMSHEIRTPMNGILGFSELLKDKGLTEKEQEKYIDTIHESGKYLLTIIDELIEVAKVDAGQIGCFYAETDVNEVIDHLLEFFKPEAEKKDIHLTASKQLDEEKARIKTDKKKLTGVLTNLIKNAIKYTDKGKIEFGYTLNQGHLEFFVKDTGKGIPEEKQEEIFERFVQIFDDEPEDIAGAGLGLYITKSYLNLMGGEIWVRSEENKGSTFYFTIPYSMEKSEKESYKTKPKKDYNWGDRTILIIEDDKVGIEYLKTLLEPTQARIITSSSGDKAISKYKQLILSSLDMILLDLRLPDVYGTTIIKEIRKQNETIPIIVQTAYADNEVRKECILAGAEDYITKPLDGEALLQMIDKYMK